MNGLHDFSIRLYDINWTLPPLTATINMLLWMQISSDIMRFLIQFYYLMGETTSLNCHWRTYCSPRIWDGERRWNDTDRGRRKTCPSVTKSTINPTWIDLAANPDICGERPATNRLSHGTAHIMGYAQRLSNVPHIEKADFQYALSMRRAKRYLSSVRYNLHTVIKTRITWKYNKLQTIRKLLSKYISYNEDDYLAQCSVVYTDQRFWGAYCPSRRQDDRNITHLWLLIISYSSP
jgi:hypothetical protein